MLRPLPTLAVLALLTSVVPAQPVAAQDGNGATVDPALFESLRYRSVGPSRGGRSTAVTGYRDRPYTFLMGAVGGGIWRTVDAEAKDDYRGQAESLLAQTSDAAGG